MALAGARAHRGAVSRAAPRDGGAPGHALRPRQSPRTQLRRRGAAGRGRGVGQPVRPAGESCRRMAPLAGGGPSGGAALAASVRPAPGVRDPAAQPE